MPGNAIIINAKTLNAIVQALKESHKLCEDHAVDKFKHDPSYADNTVVKAYKAINKAVKLLEGEAGL